MELREVVISWHDDPEDAYIVWVGIGECDDDFDDDGVCFWFADEAEFEQARTGEGFEFTIVEWEEN